MKNVLFLSLLSYLAASTNVAPAIVSEKAEILKANATKVTLSIYNSEDYIANGEDDSLDVVAAFKEKVLQEDNVDIEIAYSTFDTNEIMLSNLQTGAQNYDLICTSDYMVEKMMANNLVVPFKTGEERKTLYSHNYEAWTEDNYLTYSSPFFNKLYGDITVKMNGKDEPINDYMRGYMWGTLGIMYNPEFSVYRDRDLTPEDVKKDMSSYSSLWDDAYQGTFQIKDSMRDSYAIALLEAYSEEFNTLLDRYEKGEITAEKYNKDINIIFNNISHVDEFNDLMKELGKEEHESSSAIIDRVERALSSLKDNSYGLEVDSGKTDIQTGNRTGINLAWSGDAVYAIDSAEEFGTHLYYSIPRIGANIWLDGWVIPSTVQNQEYAQKFIDFISDPEIAAANMDYIGYTSTIAGDSILAQTRAWYDTRMPIFYAYDEENDDFVYDEHDNLVLNKEYTSLSEEEFNFLFRTGKGTIGGKEYASWEDYSEQNDLGWTAVDLDYFFQGSLTDYQDGVDTIFYTDEYEEYEVDGQTITAGRSFYAQYPPSDIVDTLMVMEDYGNNNEYVLKMWESVKSGSVPVTIVVILVIEGILLATILAYFLTKNGIAKSLRKKRRQERKA